MNNDQNEFPKDQPAADAALEARIVAWVAGEASAFEAAELERLVAERPALAEFKREMEAVHRLVGEAASPDAEPLRLAPERREKLLQVIAGEPERPSVAERAAKLPKATTLPLWKTPWVYYTVASAAAACLAVLVAIDQRQPRLYRAEAKLQFEKPETIVTTQGVVDPNVRSEIDVNTNLGILESKKLRQDVINSFTPEEQAILRGEKKQKSADTQPAPTAADEQVRLQAVVGEYRRRRVQRDSSDSAKAEQSAVAASEREYKQLQSEFQTSPLNQPPPPKAGGSGVTFGASRVGSSPFLSLGDTSKTSSGSGTVTLSARIGKEGNVNGASASSDFNYVSNGGTVTMLNGVAPTVSGDGALMIAGTLGASATNTTIGVADYAPAPGAKSSAADKSDIVVMSPFEVAADADRGYAAVNTLAGTRLATPSIDVKQVVKPEIRLTGEDVGSFSGAPSKAPAKAAAANRDYSVNLKDVVSTDAFAPTGPKVVVNERLEDSAGLIAGKAQPTPAASASRDVNDVFKYEANTEGAAKAEASKSEAVVLSPFVVANGRTDRWTRSRGRTDLPVPARSAAPTQDAKAKAPADVAMLGQAGGTVGMPALSSMDLTMGDATGAAETKTIEHAFGDSKSAEPVALREGFVAVAPASASATAYRNEVSTAQEPVSTFSLHVSDASFRLVQSALAAAAQGKAYDLSPGSIRPEEFYNAFDYGDPAPTAAEKVAARIEQAAHPFHQQRNFVRIAMKVGATGRTASQPLRLTVLLDTSGSMERPDRQAAVRRALQELITLLGAQDRITLIGFARTPRLLAEDVAGDKAASVVALASRTPPDGGTNLEEAIKLAGELALRHRDAAAKNRIVLLTDGAANLGDAEPSRLTAQVEALRQQGIAFDACGVGLEGNGDTSLEALTRHGDGRYYVLGEDEAADASFAKKLAGAFRPAAENVKLQVRFNPARVGHYRLIGFEQHRLKTEDFRNDAVDAAELAANEAAVALYEVEPLPTGESDLGEVFVRFRDPATGAMVERSWPMPYDAHAPAFDRASPSLQLAGLAGLLAQGLHDPAEGKQIKLADLAPVVNSLRSQYAQQPRVQELVTMFAQLRKISEE